MELEKKIRRYKIMDLHMDLVRCGKYNQARAVMHLLRSGRVSLGLGDDAACVEVMLEDLGCKVRYSRNYCCATLML